MMSHAHFRKMATSGYSAGRRRVVVVGAGVIGLSVAVHLCERFGDGLDITLVADKFSPDTTGDKAGMLIYPADWNQSDSLLSESEEQKTSLRWASETFKRFHSIYSSEVNASVQLVLRPGYIFRYSSPAAEPTWRHLVFGFRHVDVKSEEARAVNAPPDCTDIWAFLTYLLDCSKYLEWLLSVFVSCGGLVERRRIDSLDELHSYDIIINCTGLGSRELIGDTSLQPARGQHILAEAPWVSHFAVNIRDDKSNELLYVQPRVGNIILGGCIERGRDSLAVDSSTSDRIVAGCKEIMPSLSKARVLNQWACLRPLRDKIRLESTTTTRGTALIHCYGHGGQGGTLSWGCALDIGNLVAKIINKQTRAKL